MLTSSTNVDIATALISWQRKHGRHHLPWQNTRNPYHVWLSEIMLQQTQVSTVLGYYGQFLNRFPSVIALAQASQDDVLAMWSGLGYYSRARNLHACAKRVAQDFDGKFPATSAVLVTLPGIGRSTAAAIAAFCFSERVAILDANVARVLTRVLGFSGDLASTAQERLLWAKATDLLPEYDLTDSMPRYTQGLMDLGATLCKPRAHSCNICPLQTACLAFKSQSQLSFPVKTRKLKRSTQSIWLLCATQTDGSVYLARRPNKGVWAGLYCFPTFDDLQSLHATIDIEQIKTAIEVPVLMHALTHKDLYLHIVKVPTQLNQLSLTSGGWISTDRIDSIGLPAPIRKFLIA